MAPSTTLRVRPATRDRLNRLAQQDNVSAPDLLDALVEREEEARMLSAMNEQFRHLRSDERAWAEFKEDTSAWDDAGADV
jgi:hypothetical protein